LGSLLGSTQLQRQKLPTAATGMPALRHVAKRLLRVESVSSAFEQLTIDLDLMGNLQPVTLDDCSPFDTCH